MVYVFQKKKGQRCISKSTAGVILYLFFSPFQEDLKIQSRKKQIREEPKRHPRFPCGSVLHAPVEVMLFSKTTIEKEKENLT